MSTSDGEMKRAQVGERSLDVEALKAMAHPLRTRIYDILSQYGEQTASSLAEQLGESSGATSYHLRQLAKHGLIREVEGKGTGRERWWERPPGSVEMGGPEALQTPSGKRAALSVLRQMYQRREQQSAQFYLHDIDEQPEEWRNASAFSTTNLWLTAEQMQDLVNRWLELSDEFVERYRGQQGDGLRPVMFQFNAFPLPDKEEDAS